MIVSEMVGVGVVGFGHLGQYLVEKIKQNQEGKHILYTVNPFYNTEFNPTVNFKPRLVAESQYYPTLCTARWGGGEEGVLYLHP
jgi:hypothetical protein